MTKNPMLYTPHPLALHSKCRVKLWMHVRATRRLRLCLSVTHIRTYQRRVFEL